jgi:hypothetical protein
MPWLLNWVDAANATYKLFVFYGAKPQPPPDLVALQRNMTEYEDQYATAMGFMIRGYAREGVTMKLFMASLAPKDRTRVREEAIVGFSRNAAGTILNAIGAVILSGGKVANAQLLAAAIRDTRESWVSSLIPQDRAHMIEVVNGLLPRVPDETARNDLATFTTALQAAN